MVVKGREELISRAERVGVADEPNAPVALGVKMQAYSLSGALKYRSTAARARSMSSVDAEEVGLIECGLP